MSEKDMIKIRIRYYAVLREQRGISEEELETCAVSPRDLYETLRGEHEFSLEPEQLKVVINDAFSTWDTALTAGDTVVFIPPVAGG
jgi:molybdopterin converting factor small subunit